ncbi:MAG TPA: hypothetical protein VFB76_12775, partial [Candidatus Angelobacter sp.]|nr:hypothetical protein [Candidatus Angelobacter sp.]
MPAFQKKPICSQQSCEVIESMKRTPVASGKEKILVVNHDREGLLFTQQLLESADFLVETSPSCSNAVQRMENGEVPALILLEDALPEEAMKAIQTCRQL